MDMRNGDLYPSREAALAAGVPADRIAQVKPVSGDTLEIVRIDTGPFRGRVYRRTATGLKRARNLERRK